MSTSTRAIRDPADFDDGPARRPTKRIKLLTGAPDPAKLSWDENSLLDDWTPVVRRFLKRKFDGEEHGDEGPATTASRWRSIPLSRNAHIHTGFTQESPLRKDFLYAPTFAGVEHSFALSSQTSTVDHEDDVPSPKHDTGVTDNEEETDDDDDDENFIEHSIAVHDDTRSSQVFPADDDDTFTTTILDSFHSTTSCDSLDDSASSELPSDLPTARLPRTITALRDIPSASHLHRIVPQTVVVNLLVGIIAILPARAVRTRRGPLRDLVELLVGDESASGLKLSFWFAHEDDDGQQRRRGSGGDPLREALRGLRVRDVVLVENVALDTFREKVFGYGLRQSMQRNQTRVQLVARDGVDRVAGVAGVEKVVGVKEWVWRLVNPGVEGKRRGGAGDDGGEGDAYLPPDTQE